MEITRRNLTTFFVLFIPASVVAFFATRAWFRWFINDRWFGAGWVNWPILLSWIPDALIFALSGVALAILLQVEKLAYWALTFGGLYALVGFAISVYLYAAYLFQPVSSLFDYVWVYGGLFIPPVACALGAAYARYYAIQRLRNPGA